MKPISSFITIALLSLSASVFAGKVNINTAETTIMADQISGIGMKRAQAIVDYRKTNGKFSSVDELANIKGIGEKTIEKNRSNITL